MICDVEHLHVPVGHLCIFFGKMSNQIFCLFLIGLFGFWYRVVWAIYIVWILSPSWSHHSQVSCLFILLMVSFAVQKPSSLTELHEPFKSLEFSLADGSRGN